MMTTYITRSWLLHIPLGAMCWKVSAAGACLRCMCRSVSPVCVNSHGLGLRELFCCPLGFEEQLLKPGNLREGFFLALGGGPLDVEL